MCLEFIKQICYFVLIFYCTQIPQGQVDSLPLNFFLNNLLSMASLHSEKSDLECDNCDSGDPAVNRCTTCCHFLCDICTSAHKRGRSTKTHRVMSLEEAKEEGPIAVVRPSFCKEHEGEILKLFCETCDKAICRDCTIVKHRDHKYTFVKDAFSKEKDIVTTILSETKTKVSTLQNALDTVSEMKRSILSHVGQTEQDVRNCFDDLRISLNTRCDELINEVEELGKTKLKFLAIQQGELETALGIVQSSIEFTEKALKIGSEVEFLNMRKQMSSRLQELNLAKLQLEPCADDAVKFEADERLKQDVAAFGVITDVVTHAGASTVTMGHGSEGVMYHTLCGQQIKFTIIAKERNGQKRTEGGDLFTACCFDGSNSEFLDVRDCWDGTYTFLYTPCREGQFKLTVCGMGHDVQGSPFTWFVERWNLLISTSIKGEGQIQLSEEKLVARFKKFLMEPDDVCVPLGQNSTIPRRVSAAFQQNVSGRSNVKKPVQMKSAKSDVFGQSASDYQISKYISPKRERRGLPVFGQSASSSVIGPGQQSIFGQSASDYQIITSGHQYVRSPSQPRHEPPGFGQFASSSVSGTGQQTLFGQAASSSVVRPQPPLVPQLVSSAQDLCTGSWMSPPQQSLSGQTPRNIGELQSSSKAGVVVPGTSQLHNFDGRLYVVGSAGFNAGKHSWKAKLLGNISKGFSFGIINTGAPAKVEWVWNSTNQTLLSSSMGLHVCPSNITDCVSGDIIEMYLDCKNGTLMMYNQRTKESDIWHGVEGNVFPVFHMTKDGDQVSLLL